eukprot:6460252-Amphidinium_carterae.1
MSQCQRLPTVYAKFCNGEKGEVVASHLMAVATWVGRQARALIQGEVKDCDDLPLDGAIRSPEVQAPAGRRRWVPPEWFKPLLDRALAESPLILQRRRSSQRLRPQRTRGLEPQYGPNSARAKNLRARAHASHDFNHLAWYQVLGDDGIDHGHLIACRVCGSYAATKIGGLAEQCIALESTVSRGLQQQRNRLHKGQHPNCRAHSALRVRLLEPELENEFELDGEVELELENELDDTLQHVFVPGLEQLFGANVFWNGTSLSKDALSFDSLFRGWCHYDGQSDMESASSEH